MTDTNEKTNMVEPEDLEWIEFMRDFVRSLEEGGFKVEVWDSIEEMEAAHKERRNGTDR